jgi:hypothetical protein
VEGRALLSPPNEINEIGASKTQKPLGAVVQSAILDGYARSGNKPEKREVTIPLSAQSLVEEADRILSRLKAYSLPASNMFAAREAIRRIAENPHTTPSDLLVVLRNIEFEVAALGGQPEPGLAEVIELVQSTFPEAFLVESPVPYAWEPNERVMRVIDPDRLFATSTAPPRNSIHQPKAPNDGSPIQTEMFQRSPKVREGVVIGLPAATPPTKRKDCETAE